MTTVTIDRPGVQVIQQFQTVSPTILRPALPACVVGPSFQVVEAIDNSGAFVSDALLSVPARLTTDWIPEAGVYTGVGGQDLVLSVNRRAPVTIAFSGTDLTPEQVADTIREAQIPGLQAEVEVSGGQARVAIFTLNRGDNASLQVVTGTGAAVLGEFAFLVGYTAIGASGYNNFTKLRLQLPDYPDPRNNIGELKVDYSAVRVFINDGAGTVREVRRTETFLRGATSAVTVVDDGDGDNLSPYLAFAGANFSSAAAAAVAAGNVDLTGATFANIQNGLLRMSVDGETFQTLAFPGSVATPAAVVTAINSMWPSLASLSGGDELVLTSQDPNGGVESLIRIDKTASTALTLTELGLTGTGAPFNTVDVVYGAPFRPVVGDVVWVDGVRLGEITEVVPSPTNRLRLDTEQLLSYTGATWTIMAQGLENSASSATRPSSDLIVDTETGTVTIKHELFRQTNGSAVRAGPLSTYLGYVGLRRDITPAAEDFNMLRFGSTTALQQAMAPLDTQNPLGLGIYLALLNAPGVEVSALGVDNTTTSEPYGTLASYARAFEHLESKDVYAIAPLTHAIEVGRLGQTHVVEMSKPENGLERRLLFNPPRPTRKADRLVASTATGNVTGAGDTVETGIANLQTLLAASGKPGPTYSESDGVFIEFANDTNKYLVESVSGGAVVINDGPLPSGSLFFDANGGNVFSGAIVDRPLTIKILGGVLGDLTDEATAYAELARSFGERRVVVTAPDKARVVLEGLETLVDGYYLCAGLAGQMSALPPQQGLTNRALLGFSGVKGSNDRYGELQLKIMCGGGVWVFTQESSSSPVLTRHQLTSDMASIERREDSITRVLDFVAKTVRASLRAFIGGYNVTTAVQDAINSTLDGIGQFLVRLGVLLTFNVVGIRQSASEPDTLEVDIDLGVPYPLNRIRLTLVV
jgi:hypothetical protein